MYGRIYTKNTKYDNDEGDYYDHKEDNQEGSGLKAKSFKYVTPKKSKYRANKYNKKCRNETTQTLHKIKFIAF